MNTTDFFNLILPSSGLRCIAHQKPGMSGFQHKFTQTNQGAANAAKLLDDAKRSVYFAIASYKTDQSRRGDNAAALKTFIADIDCGEGKPYPDKRTGAKAVVQAAKLIGLSTPFLVSSGYGIHAYWPLDADLSPSEWRDTATKLKAVFAHAGLHADPARTSDVASVLRPVGTTNRKRDQERTVSLVMSGEITSHPNILTAVDAYILAHGLTISAPRAANMTGPNNDLAGGLAPEFPPISAIQLKTVCPTIAWASENAAEVKEPLWKGMLSVLAVCTDGEALAHEWSKGHPGYTPEATAAKLARVKQKPPHTCAYFEAAEGSKCFACPFAKQGRSPATLALTEAPAPKPEPAAPIVVQSDIVEAPAGFEAREDGIYFIGDGSENILMCQTVFYPISRVENTDKSFTMELEALVGQGEVRRFTIPTMLIGRGGAELQSVLASREIVAEVGMEQYMVRYLRDWMNRQRKSVAKTKSYDYFGWAEDGFVVGQDIYTPQGKTRAIISGNAARHKDTFKPVGDYDTWKLAIDQLYNHRGLEHMQFMVMCGFAAPLFALFERFGGCTISAYSREGGKGKSTAQDAALSVWAKPGQDSGMKVTGKQATSNALFAALSMCHNLPLMWDETTALDDPKFVSDLLYTVSSGATKLRLNTAGEIRTQGAPWQTLLLMSANNAMASKVQAARADTSAELARLFEFEVPSISSPLPKDIVQQHVAALYDNHGWAGHEFMRHVCKNREAVRARLDTALSKITARFKLEQNERFWGAMHASVFVALEICREQNILKFDVGSLLQWMFATTQSNRAQLRAVVSPQISIISQMLRDLAPDILVTEGEGNVLKGMPARVVNKPRGTLAGRLVRPSFKGERGWYELSELAINKWAIKNGISVNDVYKAGQSTGEVIEKRRSTLERGVSDVANAGRQVVWVLSDDLAGASGLQIVGGSAGSGGGADLAAALGKDERS